MSFDKKDLEITRSSWKATPKDYEIAPYITYAADFLLASSYTSYGAAEPFKPAYIQKPEVEFTNAEYKATKKTGQTASIYYYRDNQLHYLEDVNLQMSINYCDFKMRGCCSSTLWL